uniref:Oligomycin sensitivity conferral protein n=1 Tax=Acrobeloides nanus TaxID=290746 RepID=A0A914BWJ1_9BILA
MASNLMFKRSFSLCNVAKQTIKAPVQVHGIEGRYASALYSAAYKQKSLETVERDLKQIKQLYDADKKFQDFVLNPTLKKGAKKDAILAITKKVGVSKETENFFTLLAENGRLNKLAAVINTYDTIMRAHKGDLIVQVTSAEPLSSKHQKALNDVLQKFAKSSQKLSVNFTVKPSITGGLIVTVGDKYVDLSIATKLKKYTSTIETSV